MKTRIAILFTLIACFVSVFNVNAAEYTPIDPTDGVLLHTYYDRESMVYSGMIDVLNRDTLQYQMVAFSTVITNTDLLPNVDGHTDVYTQTDETISFYQSGTMYDATVLNSLVYTGMLTNRTYRQYEDGSACNLFYMNLDQTHERFVVCLDPTDSPNADNGFATITFTHSPFGPREIWQMGSLTQSGFNYGFTVTEDKLPATYTAFLPIVIR